MKPGPVAAAALAAALTIAHGCAPSAAPTTAPAAPTPTIPAPMASLTPRMAATQALLQRHLGAAGFRLEHSAVPFRPGEPGTLRYAPRALFRVMLSDPDSGWVVVYDLGTPDGAARAGAEFVSYLQSGFGQTNYSQDTEFTLNQVDTTLVFSWWSPGRSADPDAARAAFEALRLVGQPFPIVR